MNGAVSSAVLSGIHPAILSPEISFAFLRIASGAFPDPDAILKKWMQDPERSLGPVLKAVDRFSRQNTGPGLAKFDAPEFEPLLARVGEFEVLDELEVRRQTKRTEELLQWIWLAMERFHDASDRDIELVFLLQFLKLMALDGHFEPVSFFIARATVPEVVDVYRSVLK